MVNLSPSASPIDKVELYKQKANKTPTGENYIIEMS